jgi:hypothetical protein
MSKVVQTVDWHFTDFHSVNHVELHHYILHNFSFHHLHSTFLADFLLGYICCVKQVLRLMVNLRIVPFRSDFAIMKYDIFVTCCSICVPLLLGQMCLMIGYIK